MSEPEAIADKSRGIFARIGLSLLSLLVPGLGLIRAGSLALGIKFAALHLTFLFLLVGYFAFGPTLTIGSWAIVLIIGLAVVLICQLGSSIITFLRSRHYVSERQWWSRWYIIVAGVLVWFGIQEVAASNMRAHYRNFYVPAESMRPTLDINDRFLAKMSDFGELRRGDILIVKNEGSEYVKRLIGLPGDNLELKAGKVLINGSVAKYEETSILPAEDICDVAGSDSVEIMQETLPGTKTSHLVVDCGANYLDDVGPIQLGDDQYYFLGDNRDLSADSRVEGPLGLGVVSRDRIVGYTLFVYWSDDRKRIGIEIN
ncbi:signal peptidase I [Parasphingorhabdus sp.]|uniref:signal peptidase I n=1 Tax=Parasphingorhabdus sp. TaxID=2709688 RepID=UPI0035943A40